MKIEHIWVREDNEIIFFFWLECWEDLAVYGNPKEYFKGKGK